ncbi:class B sortase [Paenibacillus macerans]|uniref:class B sortase n=1 Tax=Paenibacillus macerans TaxID=44252 RepID=UPI001BCD772D|nr:class B sortase [Paenibacillus macerans]
MRFTAWTLRCGPIPKRDYTSFPSEFEVKEIRKTFFSVLCWSVFLYSGYELAHLTLDNVHSSQLRSETHWLYTEAGPGIGGAGGSDAAAAPQDSPEPVVRSKFHGLLALNADTAGWIEIKDTNISYPVVQGEDNDYYLKHDFKGERSKAGSIFMDFRNQLGEAPDKNIVLYGHRMKDGTMFAGLRDYLERDFFDEHRVFRFETLYEEYEVEVFAVYRTTTSFNYIRTSFADDREFLNFVDEIKERSIYKTDADIGENDVILTLSTCDYLLDAEEGRLVLQGKLIAR